jgi:hypothetical protein
MSQVVKNSSLKNVDEFNLYMLLMLLKQSYEWSNTIDKNSINHEFKYRLNNFISSGKVLFNAIEKEFEKQGDDVNELYWEQSETISKFFEFLKKSDLEKKNELVDILSSYMKNDLKINYL